MAIRGWPTPDLSCFTHVFGVPPALSPLFNAARVRDIVRAHAAHITAAGPQMVRRAGLNWTYAEQRVGLPYRRSTLSCELDHIAAFRLAGHWFLSTKITNAPSDDWLPDYARAYSEEYVRMDDAGRLVAAKMTLPILGGDGSEATPNATTSVTRWRGAAEPNQVGNAAVEHNLAIRSAVEEADMFVRQVQDAISASNIAILALPMVLNVVPVALVAEVSLPALIACGVMSDVLTALPMGIKGVELMGISRRRFATVVTRMTGVSDTSKAAAGEMWVAECRTVERVRPVGVVFVVVAAVMMTVGVLVDFCAWRFMWCGTRRKRQVRLEVESSGREVEEDPFIAKMEVYSSDDEHL